MAETILQRREGAGGGALPDTGPDGCFGIRFESIGGLGAHLAGRMLAEAGVLGQGLNGAHFSSYGSEKKGSPVRSYVRFADGGRQIRTSSPVESPHVVAVFHEAILKPDAAAGLLPHGTLVANSALEPAEVRAATGFASGTVGTVDALAIAREEKTRPNTAMLGAVSRVCPFLDEAAIRRAISDGLSHRYAHLVEPNLRTFERGRDELRLETLPTDPDAVATPPQRAAPAYGYLDAPAGGTLSVPGSTAAKDLAVSRQGLLPVLDLEQCVHCGLCDLVCPDFCLVWEEQADAVRLLGIDYRYCKGCLKCVEACPTAALAEAVEEPGFAAANRVPLFPELV